jgi:hypothetical protein
MNSAVSTAGRFVRSHAKVLVSTAAIGSVAIVVLFIVTGDFEYRFWLYGACVRCAAGVRRATAGVHLPGLEASR